LLNAPPENTDRRTATWQALGKVLESAQVANWAWLVVLIESKAMKAQMNIEFTLIVSSLLMAGHTAHQYALHYREQESAAIEHPQVKSYTI
jgi:hypothetical protein